MTVDVPCCQEPRAERKVLIPLSYEHVTEMRLAPRKRDEPLYNLQTAVYAIDCECAALGLILVSWAILVQSICPIGYFSTATGIDFARNPWHYCLVSFFKATSFAGIGYRAVSQT